MASAGRLIAASQWERSAGRANGSPRPLSASGCNPNPSQGCVTEAARLLIGSSASARPGNSLKRSLLPIGSRTRCQGGGSVFRLGLRFASGKLGGARNGFMIGYRHFRNDLGIGPEEARMFP